LDWEDVPAVDLISLELGYRLIPMVDKAQSGELLSRVKGVRKKLSQELGFLIPAVHIRDNLELPPNSYRLALLGVTMGEFQIFPEKDFAINPGQVFGTLTGIAAVDPAFGLPAFWIDKTQKEQAQGLGYTVVDASTVVATHLSQQLQEHADQLLGHEEVQKLLEILGRSSPKLLEDLVPKSLPLGSVVKILQNLLRDRVPIRDIRSISETLVEYAGKVQDLHILTNLVRIALGPLLIQQIFGFSQELSIITVTPSLEQILQKAIQGTGEEGLMLEPGLAERLQVAIRKVSDAQEAAGQPTVIVVSGGLRAVLSPFVRTIVPTAVVLAYNEIPKEKQIKIVATLGEM
jgi:flagellar biosynthesis protein FlhA